MRPLRILLTCAVTAGTLAAAFTAEAPGAGAAGTQTLEGTVRIVVVDAPDSAKPDTASSADPGTAGLRTIAMADVDGRLVPLPTSGTPPLHSGDRVRLTAVAGRNGPSVRSVDDVVPALRPTGRVTAAGSGSTLGAHTLTVLPIYWTSPDSSTRASLTSLAAATAAYWSAQSGGRITITPTVRDWQRVADPGSCDPTALANSALAANGLNAPVSNFTHVLVYFPNRADCGGWAGLGQIEGPLIWVNGWALTDVAAHEFGHNLGLGHAKTATCTGAVGRATLSPSCTVADYHDYADVMGAAMERPTGNLNSALADWLGLASTVTAAPGARTTLTLAPLGRISATRAVRVRVSGGWVYADYRPATAPDTRMPTWAGVQLHFLPDAAVPASQLLDARPSTATAFATPSLPLGTPWAVPGAGLTLTVTSVTPDGATVTVAPPTSGAATPAPVITAPSPRAAVRASVTISWTLATDAVVRVLVDGAVRGTATAAARVGSLTVTGLGAGPHVLQAQTLDATGQVAATSAPVTVTADPAAPTTPTGLAVTAAGRLSWRAGRDVGTGVAGYRLSRDAGPPVRIGVVTSAAVRTPTGRHTWRVATIDRAGNVSPAAVLVVRATRSSVHGHAVVRVRRVAG